MSLKFFLLSFSACSFAFSICNLLEPDNLQAPKGFSHRANSALTWLAPHHSSSDILTTIGHDVDLNAKFSYGPLSTDLIDEEIEIWIDTCSNKLQHLGSFKTNADGRVSQKFSAAHLPKEGSFRIWAKVVGDNTLTNLTLRILKEGTKLAVFDIDGTLTHSNVNQSLRNGSVEATQKVKKMGLEILYLTGRHYVLTNYTRHFLAESGYSDGTLILGQSLQEIVPSNSNVGEFKANRLLGLKALGFIIERAYGNDTTDIFAYLKAGISPQQIYIAGPHGALENTIALGEDFLNHLALIVF
ncbi:MAG: HAD hydrolase family protein [Myxococcota bacterium]